MVCVTSGGLNKVSMVGETFGILTVVAEATPNLRGLARWHCACECGGSLIIEGYYLRQGRRRSCGCRNTRKSGSENHRWTGYGEISGAYWYKVRANALSRGLRLDLIINEAWQIFLNQNRRCALSGDFIVMASSDTEHRIDPNSQTASLDRINSELGYSVDNSQWIHKDINRIKMNLDQIYFIHLCKKVAKHHE